MVRGALKQSLNTHHSTSANEQKHLTLCIKCYVMLLDYWTGYAKLSHLVFLLMEVKADIMYNSTYCTMGATHKILYKRSSKSEGKKLFVDKTFNIWIRVPRKVLKLWRRGKIYHVGRGNTELRSILLCFFFNKMDFLKLYK